MRSFHPGPFTWDQVRKFDCRLMNSNIRNIHHLSVSSAALFGRDLFDFNETDANYLPIYLTNKRVCNFDWYPHVDEKVVIERPEKSKKPTEKPE